MRFNDIAEGLGTVLCPLIGGVCVGTISWVCPLAVGDGNMVLVPIVKYGALQMISQHTLITSAFAKMLSLAISMNCGFIGGFVFPMIAVGAMCGAVAYQQYDYLPLGLCVGCFLAGVPAGICPMPFTLVGIPIYILYFGLYQTIPIFICVITSYTVVCGSGLFKTLADRGKPPDEGVVGGPGSMSSNISGANTGIAGQKDSEASLRESLMRKTEEEEYAANRYTNKNSNKGSVL